MLRGTMPRKTTPLGKKSTADPEALGRSRGGFTTKLHALVDAAGRPMRLLLTPGQRADITQAEALLSGITAGAVIADRAFDANALVQAVEARGATVVIPPKRNRIFRRAYDQSLYAERNKIERFFSRIKHYRRVATRYEKTASSYLAMAQVASIMTLLL